MTTAPEQHGPTFEHGRVSLRMDKAGAPRPIGEEPPPELPFGLNVEIPFPDRGSHTIGFP